MAEIEHRWYFPMILVYEKRKLILEPVIFGHWLDEQTIEQAAFCFHCDELKWFEIKDGRYPRN
jgi:hypothetical protein